MSDSCNKCGAEIEFSPNQQSLVCPYCGAVNEIIREEDIVPDDVEMVIPFSISKDDLEKQVYGLMASGDYTPDDMLESAKFITLEQVYVPAFQFTVKYNAQWTATFGYDRTEHYTEYVTVTRNGHSFKEPVTKTKTVTDWRPVNGTDAGVFDMSVYAGTLLNEAQLQPSSLVQHTFEVGKPTEFKVSFTEGIRVEGFALSEDNAFDSGEGTLNAHIDYRVKSHAQGDHQRDWHWNATHKHSTSTFIVPICHAVFDYEGQEYHVWTDGIDSSGVVADKLPEDKNRKRHVQLGFIPLGVAALTLALTSYIWGFALMTNIGLITLLLAGVYAALRRKFILDYSKKIRSALLTQINASKMNMADLSEEERENVSKAFQRPDKPLLAKIHNDKYVIPALALVAALGVNIPGYLESEGYLNGAPAEETVSEPQVEAAPAPAAAAEPAPAPVAEPEPAPAAEAAAPPPPPPAAVPESRPAPRDDQQARKNDFNRAMDEANKCFGAANYDCTLDNLRVAQQIDPSNQGVRASINKVQVTQRLSICVKNNDIECADKSSNELLRIDPNNQWAKNILSKIDSIRKSQAAQNNAAKSAPAPVAAPVQQAAEPDEPATGASQKTYKASFKGPLNIQVAKRRYPTEQMRDMALEQWKREGTILEPDGSTTKLSQPDNNNCVAPGHC